MSKTEELCRTIAEIMGEDSVAAKALKELERWRFNGWIAWLTHEDERWIVHYTVID